MNVEASRARRGRLPAVTGKSPGRTVRIAFALVAAGQLVSVYAAPSAIEAPAWLYPGNPGARPGEQAPVSASPSANPTLLHVPNSTRGFTLAQTRDLFEAVDWRPDEHPPMPSIVAHGRKPAVHACAFCHLPDGSGRPENVALAGLPAAYIVQQVHDIASGARHSAWAGPYVPTDLMQAVADSVTEQELAEAAKYFSSLRFERRDEVVEAERIPVTHDSRWMHRVTASAGDEPLGERLIVVPVDERLHDLRDPATVYRTYVPAGSLARGRTIVTTGAEGVALPCTSCHGADLRGVPPAPPLAGRSPTYILRQLLAFRTDARNTPAGQPMRVVVQQMQLDDMIAVAAYVGSQDP